jgi:hypothetical protein
MLGQLVALDEFFIHLNLQSQVQSVAQYSTL